jgi:hypothetical protein
MQKKMVYCIKINPTPFKKKLLSMLDSVLFDINFAFGLSLGMLFFFVFRSVVDWYSEPPKTVSITYNNALLDDLLDSSSEEESTDGLESEEIPEESSEEEDIASVVQRVQKHKPRPKIRERSVPPTGDSFLKATEAFIKSAEKDLLPQGWMHQLNDLAQSPAFATLLEKAQNNTFTLADANTLGSQLFQELISENDEEEEDDQSATSGKDSEIIFDALHKYQKED